MLNFDTSDLNDVAKFGLSLLTDYRNTLHSFEEAAGLCVRAIYNEFRQPDDQPTFALVRIYRLCRYDELLPELQTIATPEVTHWMALMGTVGTESAWCDRRTSQGHKVIRAVGDRSPMLSAAFEQIGLERLSASDIVQPNTLPMKSASLLTNYFHVPRALG